ncbi:hypothetical protein [Enterococcus olivae]
MTIKEYDGVTLKDGREATVIEKFDDTHFMVDASTEEQEWGIIDVTIDDIEKVIQKSK